MSKFKTADFYYGSVLSILINHKVNPCLIENHDDNRRIYNVITGKKEEYKLFLKYKSNSNSSKNIPNNKPNYQSWTFTISNDRAKIQEFVDSKMPFYIALICGEKELNDSRLVIIDSKQIKEILSYNKDSFTVSIKKGEKVFRISKNKKRNDGITIKSNRFKELYEIE